MEAFMTLYVCYECAAYGYTLMGQASLIARFVRCSNHINYIYIYIYIYIHFLGLLGTASVV
jgi:hypothetical protein